MVGIPMSSNRRVARASVAFLFDLLATAASWFGAFAIRFDLDVPQMYWAAAVRSLWWVLLFFGASFFLNGLYRGLWLFASLPDLFRLSRAVVLGSLIVAAVAFLFRGTVDVPRSVVVLTPFFLVFTMAAARICYRAWKERGMIGGEIGGRKPVLLLGAGHAGAMLAREINRSRDWRVVGFLDDDLFKQGKEILGHEVLGPIAELTAVAKERNVDTVILAIPSAIESEQTRIAQMAFRANLQVLRAPRIDELRGGRLSISSVRRIAIEDLLGRDSVVMEDAGIDSIVHDKIVMISGAGGSIGSEICRQLVRFRPRALVLLELSEFALYKIQEEFSTRFPEVATVPLVCDVKDEIRVREIFAQYRPGLVFHAAAYKHVPLMECLNSWQALVNNVIGTYRFAHAAIEYGASDFVFVSTDKAVNPVNVMGATKRLAEMVCQALAREHASETRFKIVRFGNVIGSAGSVIPKFQDQIERGGPVTVTHPDITRYFMSIPEAAQLVLKAGSLGRGGEIFVLDMGKPIRIADLARDMIRLAGHTEEQIRIEFTGLRPGEKLYEEVLAPTEETLPTPHPKLRVARSRSVDPGELLPALLDSVSRSNRSDGAVRGILKSLVPEYVEYSHITVVSAAGSPPSAMPGKGSVVGPSAKMWFGR